MSSHAFSAVGGRRVQGLDALRGLAVFLVMIRHAAPTLIGGAGIVGVTIFFALSGFLITGLLERDLARFGRPRWGRFYAHRAFRLYPALIALLGVFVLLDVAAGLFGPRQNIGTTILLGITYTSDLPMSITMSPGLTHLWSLAIEEQFYLVWPLLLFMAHRSRFGARGIAVATVILLTVTCWITLASVHAPEDIYERPTTWASSLAIGGTVYLFHEELRQLLGRARPVIAAAGLATLVALSALPDLKNTAVTYIAGPTVIAIAASAVILLVQDWTSISVAWMRPVVWLGVISYAVYLWNEPVNQVMRFLLPTESKAFLLLTLPATVLCAVVSWYTAEAAGRTLRRMFDRRSARVALPAVAEAADTASN